MYTDNAAYLSSATGGGNHRRGTGGSARGSALSRRSSSSLPSLFTALLLVRLTRRGLRASCAERSRPMTMERPEAAASSPFSLLLGAGIVVGVMTFVDTFESRARRDGPTAATGTLPRPGARIRAASRGIGPAGRLDVRRRPDARTHPVRAGRAPREGRQGHLLPAGRATPSAIPSSSAGSSTRDTSSATTPTATRTSPSSHRSRRGGDRAHQPDPRRDTRDRADPLPLPVRQSLPGGGRGAPPEAAVERRPLALGVHLQGDFECPGAAKLERYLAAEAVDQAAILLHDAGDAIDCPAEQWDYLPQAIDALRLEGSSSASWSSPSRPRRSTRGRRSRSSGGSDSPSRVRRHLRRRSRRESCSRTPSTGRGALSSTLASRSSTVRCFCTPRRRPRRRAIPISRSPVAGSSGRPCPCGAGGRRGASAIQAPHLHTDRDVGAAGIAYGLLALTDVTADERAKAQLPRCGTQARRLPRRRPGRRARALAGLPRPRTRSRHRLHLLRRRLGRHRRPALADVGAHRERALPGRGAGRHRPSGPDRDRGADGADCPTICRWAWSDVGHAVVPQRHRGGAGRHRVRPQRLRRAHRELALRRVRPRRSGVPGEPARRRRRHARVGRPKKQRNTGYLSGAAGAAFTFLRMYVGTGDERWLARRAAAPRVPRTTGHGRRRRAQLADHGGSQRRARPTRTVPPGWRKGRGDRVGATCRRTRSPATSATCDHARLPGVADVGRAVGVRRSAWAGVRRQRPCALRRQQRRRRHRAGSCTISAWPPATTRSRVPPRARRRGWPRRPCSRRRRG